MSPVAVAQMAQQQRIMQQQQVQQRQAQMAMVGQFKQQQQLLQAQQQQLQRAQQQQLQRAQLSPGLQRPLGMNAALGSMNTGAMSQQMMAMMRAQQGQKPSMPTRRF